MIAYAGYSMYVGMYCGSRSSRRRERFDTISDPATQEEKQFMSFDRFYQTFVMVPNPVMMEHEAESESESRSEYSSEYPSPNITAIASANIVPPNRFMIFRTDINGIKYYLIMDSMLQQQLPYRQVNIDQPREYADQAAICKIDGLTAQYIAPTLIREDLLTNEYKQYIDKAFSTVSTAVDTQKALAIVKAQNVLSEEQSSSSSDAESTTEHFGSFLNSVVTKGQQLVTGGSSNSVTSPVPTSVTTVTTPTTEFVPNPSAFPAVTGLSQVEIETPPTSRGFISGSTLNPVITNTTKPALLDLANGSPASGNKLTDAQTILQKTIYPRYIHHFFVSRMVNTGSSSTIPTLLDVIGGTKPKPNDVQKCGCGVTGEDHHHGEYHAEHHNYGEMNYGEMHQRQNNPHVNDKPAVHVNTIPSTVDLYYRFSAMTRDQVADTLNMPNKTPFSLTVTKSFAPGTLLRKRTVTESVKVIKPGTTQKVTKDVPIINDKKFICGVQPAGIVPDNFYNIYVDTVTPQLDQIDAVIPTTSLPAKTQESKQEYGQEMEPRVDDTILFTGKNNTNVTHMEPTVNLYFYGDFRSSSGVLSNVKCWFAKLDTYTDPTATVSSSVVSSDPSTDPRSPYFGLPKTYPVGIIPADYKQCNTTQDGKINTYCRGNTYVNGVDYSDARKICFEVASVQLNAM